MRKALPVFLLFTIYYLLFTIPSSAQEQPPPEPTPRCECSPGAQQIRCDYENKIPESWCCRSGKSSPCPEEQKGKGMGVLYVCNDDCQSWSRMGDVCTTDNQCAPAKPQITPMHYSFEESVGNFNEGMEKAIHSGTRDVGIDPSKRDNYGAVAALIPAGGPNHELRVNFVKEQGDYEVVLANGAKKKAQEIWNECTENGDLNKWQAYQEKLENCPNWGFVPTTYRRLAAEPTPAVKTRQGYFQEKESPFVMGWGSLGVSLGWIVKFFQDIFCSALGWFCPADPSLPLKNPFDAPGWTKDKLNVPAEAESNARLLRQFLLPKDFPLGELPKGEKTYFETKSRDPKLAALLKKTLEETGRTTRLTAAEGGLFRIFQPKEIKPKPAVCDEENFNPPEECASEYYFNLQNASPGYCGPGKICYSDTPDQETFGGKRPIDDRPLFLRSGLEFLQQSLWPKGLTGGR